MAGEETRMEAEGTGLIKTENEDLDSTIFLCTEKKLDCNFKIGCLYFQNLINMELTRSEIKEIK